MTDDKADGLRRQLGLGLLLLYGLGVTVGAGIYVLVGVTAGRAGMYAPFSFFAGLCGYGLFCCVIC